MIRPGGASLRLVALATVLVLAVSLGVSACSDDADDDAGGDGNEEPVTRTTRGITDTEVRVGGVFDAALYRGVEVGTQARLNRANLVGGVFGRTVTFAGFQDDASTPELTDAAARALVEQNQVFALLPVVTTGLTDTSYLADQQVPFFGWGISSGFCGNDIGFGFTGCLSPPGGTVVSNAWGVLLDDYFAGDTDGKTAAIVAEDSDAGTAAVGVIDASFADVGIDVVSDDVRLPVGVAIPDYTPYAAELVTADAGAAPDVVALALSANTVVGLAAKLRELGFTGVQTNQVLYDPRLVGVAAGSVVFIQFAAFQTAAPGADPPNAAVAQMVADVQAVAPGQALTQQVAAGYWAADMFLRMLEATGEDLTVERFLQVANDDFSWSVPDTVGESVWPRDHDQPVPCGSLVEAEGVDFVVRVPFTCGEVITR